MPVNEVWDESGRIRREQPCRNVMEPRPTVRGRERARLF